VKNTCVCTSGSQSITILSSTSIVITLGSDISLRKLKAVNFTEKKTRLYKAERIECRIAVDAPWNTRSIGRKLTQHSDWLDSKNFSNLQQVKKGRLFYRAIALKIRVRSGQVTAAEDITHAGHKTTFAPKPPKYTTDCRESSYRFGNSLCYVGLSKGYDACRSWDYRYNDLVYGARWIKL
jgi:hypothetical protein